MKQNQGLNVSNMATSIGHNPLDPNEADPNEADPNQASPVHQDRV